MRLDRYSAAGFDRGRPLAVEALWYLLGRQMLASILPGSGWRRALLRLFGARIGQGVVIKPGVRVKLPWRLQVGDHSWIGEGAWIDNLAEVTIGPHVCISQGAFLCTGSHDWGLSGFDLITRPIVLEEGSWVGARANVAPGVRLERFAILAMGSTATQDLRAMTICQGNPAVEVRKRAWRDGAALADRGRSPPG